MWRFTDNRNNGRPRSAESGTERMQSKLQEDSGEKKGQGDQLGRQIFERLLAESKNY